MSLTCHTPTTGWGDPSKETWLWRAFGYPSAYQGWFGEYDQLRGIEAKPDAVWKRADPFTLYKPAIEAGELEDGPHVKFLNLKNVLTADRGFPKFRRYSKAFADVYGLLGMFRETLSPVLPDRVDPVLSWVAPDAVIKNGKLRTVNSATKGKELLEELLYRRHGPSEETGRMIRLGSDSLALPHELEFSAKGHTGLGRMPPIFESSDPNMLSWKQAKDKYGVHAVLDEHEMSGVSLISTREPLIDWRMELLNFPSPPYTAEYEFALSKINQNIADVSSYGYIDDNGEMARGYRSPSLLQAIYYMLFLDVTGGITVQQCKRQGCTNYFRASTQSRRIYCREGKCASRVSTQRWRARKQQEL